MFNLQIHFSYPWLLLLIIPAALLVLVPYFLLSKKYRRTRNRIVSIVLSMAAMILCIAVLAGLNFTYEVYNAENEILLVVDMSYSTQDEKDLRDSYVESVLSTVNTNIYKVGVVTFGYDQKYPVPISSNLSGAYEAYLNAEQPDVSATDIAAALTYANSLFTNPEAAKIVLISDGFETDETALSVIKTIVSDGVRIDTVCCDTLSADQEVQIVDAELPDYNVTVGEKFSITLTLQNNYMEKTAVSVKMVDNEDYENATVVEAEIGSGVSTVTMDYAFSETEMHVLNFIVTTDSDRVEENNSFYSYMYLVKHEDILIIENYEGDSDALYDLLKDEFNPTVVNVSDPDFPMTLAELRCYDEVILNNIANSDLPDGFIDVLYEYVYRLGGGLFTVGGSDPYASSGDTVVAHAYDRDDMSGTLLQSMLPVQAIDYTPPLGLAIVVDVSGSMGSGKVDAAKNAAADVVKDETCLSERDYVAILTLANSYTEESKPISMTRQDEILDAIYNISGTGGTNFTPAITKASQELLALYTAGTIQKMHVVIITDAGASDKSTYPDTMAYYYSLGVTFSFIIVDAVSGDYYNIAKAAAEACGGSAILCTETDMTIQLKNDIRVPTIKDVQYGEYVPTLNTSSSFGSLFNQEDIPSLYGFYGTKARSSAEVVLTGKYGVPIYAQWKYGNGMVGSFMCDLYGQWSADWLNSDTGVAFIITIVNKLFPTEDIGTSDISVILREDNYSTQVSIYTETPLEEDESIVLEVVNLSADYADIQVVQPAADNEYSRASIVAKVAGVYSITVLRYKGSVLVDSYTVYRTLSYSEEYNLFSTDDGAALMAEIASLGDGGAYVLAEAEAFDVFEGFVTSLGREYDPRMLFMILALILFLLDIAVRKFKFKWPHEIVRSLREKQKAKSGAK